MKKIDSAFIYDVPNHEEHKKIIIELIKKIPQNKLNEDQISHTDYNLPSTMRKDWQHYFYKNIYNYFKDSFEDLIHVKLFTDALWFQWYETNDYHDWHTHPKCHFTNIYYLNLPNKNIKTVVKDFDNFKNFDIKEGQILTFPSFWKHKSPPNNFKESKIIISFNTNVE
tara:strand:+ start:78 stop:581 length:504 start_codon:yes stop_codon:yes gene_type:complete